MVDPLAGHGGFAESTGGPVKMRRRISPYPRFTVRLMPRDRLHKVNAIKYTGIV
jgi:hypothetical protein